MKPLADCRLYAFVDTAYLHGHAPELVAQQLCDGGADLIQLRAKTSSPDEIRVMAQKILPITRKADVGLVINDYPDIAQEIGADLCHLGQEDMAGLRIAATDFGRNARPARPSNSGRDGALRRPLGRPGDATLPRIGISTHSPEQAKRALAVGPAYIAIGPVYATGTKPGVEPVTLEYVCWAARNVKIPWFAIGGINLENLDDVLAVGAKRIAVVSAILNAPDMTKTCVEFKRRLK